MTARYEKLALVVFIIGLCGGGMWLGRMQAEPPKLPLPQWPGPAPQAAPGYSQAVHPSPAGELPPSASYPYYGPPVQPASHATPATPYNPGVSPQPVPSVAPARGVHAQEAMRAPAPPRIPAPAAGQFHVPQGVYVKTFESMPYGSGKITWNYQGNRVLGTIEASVMGFEVTVETDAEISMSRNGTVYGIINSLRVTRLKMGQALGEEAMVYASFLPLAEPLINAVFTDLPFSYRVRMVDDRMTILSFRTLLAGPNPMLPSSGPLMMFAGGSDNDGAMAYLMYFQMLGMAMEGNYKHETPAQAGAR